MYYHYRILLYSALTCQTQIYDVYFISVQINVKNGVIDMLSSDTYKLENAFHILNQNLFGGTLPTVMITIQSSRSAYGHCTTQKVWASGGEMMYELNLGAEYLDRPIENVMATLVHEMVHIYCME